MSCWALLAVMAKILMGTRDRWAGRANSKTAPQRHQTKKPGGAPASAGASAPDILQFLISASVITGRMTQERSRSRRFSSASCCARAALLRSLFLGAPLVFLAAAFSARIRSSSRCLPEPVGSLFFAAASFLPLLFSGEVAAFFGVPLWLPRR